MTMKIKKMVATTHEARLVRPDGGRGRLLGLVGTAGLAAMGGGGSGLGGRVGVGVGVDLIM